MPSQKRVVRTRSFGTAETHIDRRLIFTLDAGVVSMY